MLVVLLIFWRDVMICRHGTGEISHHAGMRARLAVHVGYMRDGWDEIRLNRHLGSGCLLGPAGRKAFLRSLRNRGTVAD